MINTEMQIEGKNTLVIKVDLSKENGRSKSGKTIIIGGSQGAAGAPAPFEGVKVNLNVYKYPTT